MHRKLVTSLACQMYGELFDAENLNTKLYDASTPSLKAALEAKLTRTVIDTAEAIEACHHCPILNECKKRVLASIEQQAPPTEVIQAGIYWGPNSQPDFTLNGCLTKNAANHLATQSNTPLSTKPQRIDKQGKAWPLTVPVYANAPEKSTTTITHGPVDQELNGWDLTWLPPIPQPISPISVSLVIDTRTPTKGIPQTKLRFKKATNDEGHEVLTDAEVCEALRRMYDKGWTLNEIARHLNINPRTTRDLLIQLGAPITKSEIRSQSAIKREARLREKRLQEQQAKELAMASIIPSSEAAWDQAAVGEQLDLCAAAFAEELAA